MRRLHLIVFCVALVICLDGSVGWACRYNVLEVGFIDLGIEPYRLFGYVTTEMSAESVSTFRDGVEAALIDANVQFELVYADRDADHSALRHLASHGIEAFPAAVLVSPDGQSLPIDLSGPNPSLRAALDGILTSPTRAEILEKAAGGYGVVLVIEGPDETANTLARDAAEGAVHQVGAQMEFMPKPIAGVPQVVTLAAEDVPNEKVLLWSLGAEPVDINEPHAAVFYGRGRWIGPLFRGEQITKRNLERVLFVIGADCECGLDHRWLQGTMLPARWDEGLQAKVAETLGFDPESPMVKMEMISIVRRGMGGAAVPGVPFGYREIEIGSVPDEGDESGQAAEPVEAPAPVEAEAEPAEPAVLARHEEVPEIPPEAMPAVDMNAPAPQQEAAPEAGSPMSVVALALGGVAVCVVVVGIVVFVTSRRR